MEISSSEDVHAQQQAENIINTFNQLPDNLKRKVVHQLRKDYSINIGSKKLKEKEI